MLSWWRNWGWFGLRRIGERDRGRKLRGRRKPSRRRNPARTTLRVEQLEDRTTPTNNIPLHPVHWTALGPWAINPQDAAGNPTNNNPWSGPIAGVAATGSTWYVATVGGGIWKTTDAGNTWTPLTDYLVENIYTTPGAGPLQNVSLSFGMIAVAPNNPNFV
ncbi:MAG: hypothetical protein RMJ82_15710, partial [Gemmatales bacterium]|nr:hypothetical protein [Gemmatales bacterium]